MRNKIGLTAVLLLVMVTVVSYSVLAARDTLLISGLEPEIEVSVAELKELPVVEKEVVSVNSSGEENEYSIKGALLADVLKKHGRSQQDLKAVRFVAGDGYAIDVDENILKNRDIILAYLINGQPIEERYQPVRAVIPEERAMYWVKNLVEIEVLEVAARTAASRLFFLETVIPEVETTEYTYYENVDQAVRTAALVEKLGAAAEMRAVEMVAVDGYEKTEDKDIFDNGYLKVTGGHAPMFLSPDIPKGMYVKDLLFVNYGGSAICSVNQALQALETAVIDDMTGIKLVELFNRSGLTAADKYTLQAIDGYAVEVTAADLENGIIYLDGKGRVRSYFSGLPKNTSVKYLYLIEPVE